MAANERALQYRVGEQIHGFTVEQVSSAAAALSSVCTKTSPGVCTLNTCFGWSVIKMTQEFLVGASPQADIIGAVNTYFYRELILE